MEAAAQAGDLRACTREICGNRTGLKFLKKFKFSIGCGGSLKRIERDVQDI
jgi:hypothetical protein